MILPFFVLLLVSFSSGWCWRGRGWCSGGGGQRLTQANQNSWLPAEVNRFKSGLGRCGPLYTSRVTKCLQDSKSPLHLSSNILQDIQAAQAINTNGCPGCRISGGVPTAPGPRRSETTGPKRSVLYAYRLGSTVGDAIEFTHLIQEQAVLQATDPELSKACDCFSNAFAETVRDCKLSQVMCKTVQTCSPTLSCPLVQPPCSPNSNTFAPQTPITYSCEVDYCSEGTGSCDHAWWASTPNSPSVPASCGDSSTVDQNNHQTFDVKALCQVLSPNKRSTTYTVVLTTSSTSPADLSAGEISGLVIGVVVVVLVLVGALAYFISKRNSVTYQ